MVAQKFKCSKSPGYISGEKSKTPDNWNNNYANKITISKTKAADKNSQKSPSETTRISFEEILENLGCFGPFQVLVLFLYLLLEIACSFTAFIPIFVGRSTSTSNCNKEADEEDFSENITESMKAVISVKSLVNDFYVMMDSPFKYESIVDEWDLTCDRSWMPDIFTSCLMAGMIVGNVIASQMADWYGRRKTYLMVLVFMALGTLMSAISPTIYFYACSRFLAGAAFCGFINVSCMAVMEFMTPKWRSVANCAGPMGEGIVLLSILGYFIRPWRMLYLSTLSPYLLIIPIYVYLPESPRWLLRNNKMQEAHDVLHYMAKVNGRKPISMETLEALRTQEEVSTAAQKNKRISYLDFIRNRSLFITSIYLFAIWFAWNVGYYGISYNIRNVDGNPYINLGLIGIANAIGQRFSFVICDWIGRRRAVLASMSFSASALVSIAICFIVMEEVSPAVIITGCFFGLLGLASSRASARLLSGESFPTAVRTMGLGVGGLGANIAGLITPQLAYVGSKTPSLPFFIFAAISVAGSLVVFMMKETSGSPLSDELQLDEKKKDNEV